MPNLRKQNRELIQLLEAIRNDLLMRGTKDDDGTTIVELGAGNWYRLNDTITKHQIPETQAKPDIISKLPEHHKQWFQQLKLACANGDLALMSCLDSKTMEPRSVLSLVSHDDGMFNMTPVGHLCPEDNPYEAYIPPRTEQETIR